jgi:hypothetical protein
LSTALEQVTVKASVRCVWFMGYRLRESETPSGKGYLFRVEESRVIGYGPDEVHPDDVEYILSLHRPGGGCCGGSPGPFHYFVRSEL